MKFTTWLFRTLMFFGVSLAAILLGTALLGTAGIIVLLYVILAAIFTSPIYLPEEAAKAHRNFRRQDLGVRCGIITGTVMIITSTILISPFISAAAIGLIVVLYAAGMGLEAYTTFLEETAIPV